MLAAAALVLSACRIEVVAELDLRDDGSGTAALDLFLDRELLGMLDELAVDAVGEIEGAVAEADAWELEVIAEGADGMRLRLEHEGPDPAAALGELSDGLAADDPGLITDLEVRREVEEGMPERVVLRGDAQLRAPRVPGVVDEQGEPLGPDEATLERLTREHVEASLVVTMPGTVQEHDAPQADDTTLQWDLPVGERVEVAATSEVGSLPVSREVMLAAAAGLLLVVAGVAVFWVVRRRRA